MEVFETEDIDSDEPLSDISDEDSDADDTIMDQTIEERAQKKALKDI